MDIRFEHIEQMPPSERDAFLRAIGTDEAMRREYANWLAIAEAVRKHQEDVVPERSILVLAALQRAGLAWALTDEERLRLEDEWPRIAKAFTGTSFLDDVLARIVAEAADFDRSWGLREGHLRTLQPLGPARRQRAVVRGLWRASAVAAVVVFIGLLLFVLRRDAAWVRLDVPADDVRSIALVDGSTVRLIGPAQLEYRPAADESYRPGRLRLSGDAFFDVVPSDQPFAVETPTALVTVLGTSFGVRSYQERTEVVVATGRVSVEARGSGNAPAVVGSGQLCSVALDGPPSTPVSIDLREALAWANLFVFRATPLREIAATLSEHYGARIEVDPGLAETTITGTFASDRELSEILQVIAKAAGASVVESPSGFQIVPERLG